MCGGAFSHQFVQRTAIDLQILEIAGSGIGGAAQNHHATIAIPQERLKGVTAHVWIHGDGIGTVTREGFEGILFGRAADVTALGIKNDRHMRCVFADMRNGCQQHVFEAGGSEIGDLRLVGADQIACRVDDGTVEGQHARSVARQVRRESTEIGIQADAHQRVGALPGLFKFFDEGHKAFRCGGAQA